MSVVVWEDDGVTYLAQSPAHAQVDGFEPLPFLTVEELVDRVALVEPESWREQADGAQLSESRSSSSWERFWGDEDVVVMLVFWAMVVLFCVGLLVVLIGVARAMRGGSADHDADAGSA